MEMAVVDRVMRSPLFALFDLWRNDYSGKLRARFGSSAVIDCTLKNR
jgi:hypothetical protein